ncbi:hypothetical protein L1987_68766 [Smallanthus sonchifolius]|uniref:Uncharacterized protein n=1 Tax=Smallanthus sonchifolius TaxID=185202 RepID=A0ACB9B453_9ASTR|nr:hypothetical protein L1987_68766 [Smallanthus sonchifolius]
MKNKRFECKQVWDIDVIRPECESYGFCGEADPAYLSSTHEEGPAYLSSTHEEGNAYLSSTHEEGPTCLSSTHEEGPAYLSSTHEAKFAHLLSTQEQGPVHLLSTQASGCLGKIGSDVVGPLFRTTQISLSASHSCHKNKRGVSLWPVNGYDVVQLVTPDSSVAAALVSMANKIKELKLSARQVSGGGHDTRDCLVNNQEQKIEEMFEIQTQMLAHLVQRDRDARQRLDEHDTLLKNQQSAFQDLQRTVEDIA